MYTQCSKCETVFKLSAEVLRAAGGQVRCGKCGEVFNALAHLAEDPSAFVVEETEIDLEFRADSILESPAPMTPAREEAPDHTDFGRPGVETARLHIDWDVSEEPPAEDEGDASLGDTSLGDASMEFTCIHSGMPFGVTFSQCLPPSCVTCTKPSSVPTQSNPFLRGDSAMVKITS